jgi:hypothetical protein
MAVLIRKGLLYSTEWQPSEDISWVFFSRAEKPSKDMTRAFISDYYKRVNAWFLD